MVYALANPSGFSKIAPVEAIALPVVPSLNN